MNVVDSSAWIEYFNQGPNAPEYAPVVQDIDHLIVPSLVLFEVFKRVAGAAGEDAALQVIGLMLQGNVVELTATIAIEAARLSLLTRLAMADSVILATARAHAATLWTQDGDFQGIDGVRYLLPA